MAKAVIQFGLDDTVKRKADIIFERLGIDLLTYMRICIFRLVQENGILFSVKIEELYRERKMIYDTNSDC